MNNLILILVCSLCASFVNAKESMDKKTVLIDELIEVTNALDFAISSGDMVASAIVQQSGLSPQISVIMSDEIKGLMREELIENGFARDLMHRLYKKHFTLVELEQLVTFYQSDVGKKAASVLPLLSQEAMQMTQEYMVTINPKLQKRLIKVLQSEQVQ
jgi:hypothetical protein